MGPLPNLPRPSKGLRPLRRAIPACLLGCILGANLKAENPAFAPLAPRSKGGATLFTSLEPQAVGLVTTNRYDDPRFFGDRFSEFSLGAIGTGITVGDFDRDGWPDLFVVSKTEASRLFRNRGDGTFEDVTARAGLDDGQGKVWKQGASFADVNGDGWLDLYLCRYDAPNQLWINQADGTFKEEAAQRGVAVSDASGMAVFGDYDRDGDLDLYLVTNLLNASTAPEGQPDFLFRNEGDGRFRDVTQEAGIRGPGFGHSALWWDFDEDGWPDLYVANDFAGLDAFYRNNRDGTFSERLKETFPYVSYSSMGSDLTDADNDGHVDLFVAEMASTERERDLRTMAESRAQMNRPGATTGQMIPQVMRNVLFLAGAPHLREAACLGGIDATDWTWSPRWEDFDGDGRLDLFATNGMILELHNADLHARLRGKESIADRLAVMRSMPVMAEPNLAFRNEGDLRFTPVTDEWGLYHSGVSFGSATVDFDGDGDPDLVYSNYQDGLRIYRNDSQANNRLSVRLIGRGPNTQAIGAVVRVVTPAGLQARPVMLARGYLSTSDTTLSFGLGEATSTPTLSVTWPDGTVQTLHNIGANQRVTLTQPAPGVTKTEAPSPPLFTEQAPPKGLDWQPPATLVDEPAQPALLPWRQNQRGPALAVADLSGDGEPEVVVGGANGGSLRILYLDTSGTWTALPLGLPPSTVADGPILAADLDGDGRRDLLVTKGGVTAAAGTPALRPNLLLANAEAGLVPAPDDFWPADLRVPIGAIAAADVDHDGDLDLFVGPRAQPRRYPQTAPARILLNDGRGRFSDGPAGLLPAGLKIGPVSSARWSDMDGDGWVDLLVLAEGETPRAWRNLEGKTFQEKTTDWGLEGAGRGLWTSLAAADFNGDGKPDYAVGNLGTNTSLRASATEPYVVLQGDFKGNGSTAILEARLLNGAYWPLRPRSELGGAFPELLRKFPTHAEFARASLAELFPAEKLAAARRLEVTRLDSGFLLSQPDGTWSFSAAPRLSQLGPWQGLEAGDFDGDGRVDLLVVQNSRAQLPSNGPALGAIGCLLRGDGRGGLRALEPNVSGISIPGDAEALVRLSTSAGLLRLVARHSQPLRVIGPPAAAPVLRVDGRRLPPGLWAGARVTFVDDAGRRTTLEGALTEGWLSQSEAVLDFPLAGGRMPAGVEVRWPDGQVSKFSLQKDERLLELKAP